jgi:sulfatase modifying factor 1
MGFRTSVMIVAAVLTCGAARGEDYAFLVGIKDYDAKQLRPLEFARDDMTAFRDVLVTSGYKPENVVLMQDDPRLLPNPRFLADSTHIRSELKLLLDIVEPQDTMLIAFAGHGVQFKGEAEHYFCPRDANLTDRKTLISLTELYDRLKACPSRQKLLLVDACRNDPASDLARTSGAPELESVTQPQITPPPEGVVALFSCAEGQQAFEHPDLKHGVFFYHVLEGWRGEADDGNKEITLDEIVAYTKSKTKDFARLKLGAPQTPRQQGFIDGEWTLRRISHPRKLTNSIGMSLVLVDSGEFWMGSDETETELRAAGITLLPEATLDDERPRHRVRITRPFYLSAYETTVDQFRQFVTATRYKTEAETNGTGQGFDAANGYHYPKPEFNWRNTGYKQTGEHPVMNVSWKDALEFCRWLSNKENAKYRLPTEAEWEYACRAGTTTRFSTGDSLESLRGYCNIRDSYMESKLPNLRLSGYPGVKFSDGTIFTASVGSYKPNAWGLYDMHGNAWEWCFDANDADAYRGRTGTTEDPVVTSAVGGYHIIRGGGWYSFPIDVRIANRVRPSPTIGYADDCFRVVREP